jgi:phosphoribosylformylglycinamidine (FGAM) synthase PurS component
MSSPRRPAIRIDRRVVRPLIGVVVVLVVLIGLNVAANVGAPRATATAAELDAQRATTERAVQRIYLAAVEQLRTTRSLRLAITDAQAATIEQKYVDQLNQLRRSALAAIGEAYGQNADQSAQYATQAETRLGTAVPTSAAPLLLAPRLYAIVERMGQLTSQLGDAGIKEMTQTPPAPTPTVTPRPSASPSPTR